MVILELMISSLKLIVIFTSIGVFILSVVFKLMSGTMYYYYKRDLDFVGYRYAFKDTLSVARKFKPVFQKVSATPLGSRLRINTAFAGKTRFGNIFPLKRVSDGLLTK